MRRGFHPGIADKEFDRRVHQREFEALLGCGSTWFRKLELDGKAPPARRDPGAKRKYWLASEVRRTLKVLAKGAEKVDPAEPGVFAQPQVTRRSKARAPA